MGIVEWGSLCIGGAQRSSFMCSHPEWSAVGTLILMRCAHPVLEATRMCTLQCSGICTRRSTSRCAWQEFCATACMSSDTGPKPTLAHFSASIILPPFPLSPHCPCRISWLPLCAAAVRECCGNRKKYTRCMECFSCEKLYSRAWGALLRQAILMASHTRPCVCGRR